MQKNLSQLLSKISYISTQYTEHDPVVKSLIFDSRAVTQDSLFFALPGTHVHGNEFICKAIEQGASVIIYQDTLPENAVNLLQTRANSSKPVSIIKVESTRFAMSPIADAFFDTPSAKMGIIGVTGTEGKSTTVFLVWQLLRFIGKKAGFISTVQYSLGDEALNNPEHQTTPEATIVQEKLHQMVLNGCEFAVVESSSHGLSVKTNRLGDVRFDGVAMMNVTHEHLEFHGTHEQYKFDKANLFRALDKFSHTKIINGKTVTFEPFGVVNEEDPSATYFAKTVQAPVYGFTTFGVAGGKNITDNKAENAVAGTLYAKNIQITHDKCLAELSQTRIPKFTQTKLDLSIPLPGAFNIYNTMAAILLVSGMTNTDVSVLVEKSKDLLPVKGRMTAINKGQPFEVIVDYAHTPSSFETIFPPLKQRCKGKLISLFGSGGERDTQKRSVQGKIASQWCSIVFLADEDPRNEDPVELLEMIASGCTDENGNPLKREDRLYIIPDRKKAIRKAFEIAQPGDIVLLLGKAHENSIIYKDYVMPYDEIAEAEKALSEMGFTK